MMSARIAPVRRLHKPLWHGLLRGVRRRREMLVRRDTTSWPVAAEVLEQRTLLSSPTLDWGVAFGATTGASTINSTAVDSAGDVYVAGVVTHGTVDLDPGSGTANVTADVQTGFVAKYGSSGAFLWVETFASDRSVNAFSLSVDASGGVYVSGGFRGTTTFGVGESNPATLVNQGGAGANGFVAKLDQTTGDVDWVDGILGDFALATTNVVVDSSGRVFIAGQSESGTVTITDGETGTTRKTFTSSSSNYVARLESDGAVTWAEGFADGKATIVAGSGLAADGSGDVYLTGALAGKDVDFNPGSGSFTLSRTARLSNTFVAKLDVDGNFLWAIKDDATGWKGTSGSSIAVDASGNAYLTIQQTGSGWGWDCGWNDGGWSSASQRLAKVDSSGAWQWNQALTPTPPEQHDCDDPSAGESCHDGWSNDVDPHHDWSQDDVPHDNWSNDDWSHDDWSHGDGNSVPCWTPPASDDNGWQHGGNPVDRPVHQPVRAPSVSQSTAKVALDGSGNPVVVSATSGAAAYSSTGSIVWSTTTPMPVTDIAVDSSGSIVFAGLFNGQLNVSPDGTYLLDSNTWWRRAAPFLVRWNVS